MGPGVHQSARRRSAGHRRNALHDLAQTAHRRDSGSQAAVTMNAKKPLWRPAPERVSNSRLTAFVRTIEGAEGRSFEDYQDLHRWSVNSAAEFWTHVWRFCGVIGQR